MMSAFGVEHGEVSKSFRKLNPKLIASLKGATEPSKAHTMDQRVRHNYAMFRAQAGGLADKRSGAAYRAYDHDPSAGEYKAMARTQVTAAGNRSKRKGRVLP